MAETPTHRQFGRRRLVAIIEALRPLGLNATLSEFALALAPLCEGKDQIRIESRMIANLVMQARHQQLINGIILAGCKRHGYDTTYKDLYPIYLKACRIHRINPVSLKTFQNRALQRESWYEMTLKKVMG